jgi:hypothetical protein
VALVERRAVEVESAADAFVVLDVALVVAIVAPTAVSDVDVVEFVVIVDVVTAIAVADVDVVVVVAVAVVDTFVVAVVGKLVATGRLVQKH